MSFFQRLKRVEECLCQLNTLAEGPQGEQGEQGDDGPPGPAGGCMQFPYTYSISDDQTPAAGEFQIDAGTIFIHGTDDNGEDRTATFDFLTTGFLYFVGEDGVYYLAEITAQAENAGIYELTISFIDGAEPIVDESGCILIVPGGSSEGGGQSGFSYAFDDSLSGDPGSGRLLLDNATLASVTSINISETDADANALGPYIATWDDSTNTVRGHIIIRSVATPTDFAIYSVTGALTDNGTNDTIPLTHVASGGAFVDGEAITIEFIRAGNVGAAGAAGASAIGKMMVPIDSQMMQARITNGPSSGLRELSSNKIMVPSLDFDPNTEEYAQFRLLMPSSWDEGTVTFRVHWAHPATTVNFGVAWKLRAVAISDDDAMDAAFGTAIAVTDTGGTTNDHYRTDESAAVTVAGTPATSDMVLFELFREISNGSDTMAVDAYLLGIELFITTDTATDS